MELERFQFLLEQYKKRQLSGAEYEELLALTDNTNEEQWETLVTQLLQTTQWQPAHLAREFIDKELLLVLAADKMPLTDKQHRIPSGPRVHLLIRWRWVAAAIIFVLLTVSSFFWLQHNHKQTMIAASQPLPVNRPPGHQGAILTLADGSQLVLDSLNNGVIANQKGAHVVLNNGQLLYDAQQASEISYNTITTPHGRQYALVLSDGSRVWLNAGSSLKYPTTFSNEERIVELSGEAYFEVTRITNKGTAKKIPFIVKTISQQILVLGTSFNINAYSNEAAAKTTLIEGMVRVAAAGASQVAVVLKPGQQAVSATITGSPTPASVKVIDSPDIDQIIAWKNGAFNFEDLPLEEAMRQLERWYDIKVIYENGIPDIRFFGGVDRNMNLGDLLEMFAEAGLKYRMEGGGKLIVMNGKN
ncbi:FecR family protein [Chitinophaga sp. HK235]|uniref:FecR family protein n=1 Tax=Chitinophaga sp. HK235 TaxID=2952571 RepID=UPI001BA6B7A9|nr:FecR family protein [Chitinophaga sp. HK235]